MKHAGSLPLEMIQAEGAAVSSEVIREPGGVEEGIVSHFHVLLMNRW